jgi:hypothetical protein
MIENLSDGLPLRTLFRAMVERPSSPVIATAAADPREWCAVRKRAMCADRCASGGCAAGLVEEGCRICLDSTAAKRADLSGLESNRKSFI